MAFTLHPEQPLSLYIYMCVCVCVRVCVCVCPNGHMTFIQCHIKVAAMSRRCKDVNETLNKSRDVASTLIWLCINVMCPLGIYICTQTSARRKYHSKRARTKFLDLSIFFFFPILPWGQTGSFIPVYVFR